MRFAHGTRAGSGLCSLPLSSGERHGGGGEIQFACWPEVVAQRNVVDPALRSIIARTTKSCPAAPVDFAGPMLEARLLDPRAAGRIRALAAAPSRGYPRPAAVGLLAGRTEAVACPAARLASAAGPERHVARRRLPLSMTCGVTVCHGVSVIAVCWRAEVGRGEGDRASRCSPSSPRGRQTRCGAAAIAAAVVASDPQAGRNQPRADTARSTVSAEGAQHCWCGEVRGGCRVPAR